MALRYIVVDDERCITETLAIILRQSGYEASAFYSALNALSQDGSRAPEVNPSTMPEPIRMKEQIQRVVDVLAGRHLWELARTGDLACFSFGQPRTVTTVRGEVKVVGEFALRIQCAWRITQGEKIIVGSHDMFCPPEETDEPSPDGFDWEHHNRFDRIVHSLFQQRKRPFLVQQVVACHAGSLIIILDEGYAIELFPNDSETGEHWRFYRPYKEDTHLVVTGNGIEE